MRRSPALPIHGPPRPCRSVRGGPPYAMTEMIAAEPALAERLVRRLTDDTGRPGAWQMTCGPPPRPADRSSLTGCGTSEHAAMVGAALLDDALRAAGMADPRVASAQAFELTGRPPGQRPGDRRVARRRDVGHQRGAAAGGRGRRDDRADHRQRPLAGRRAGRPRGADRRAGPELVPHGWLPVADADRRGPGRDAARAGAGPRCGARAARQRGPRRERRSDGAGPAPMPPPAGGRLRRRLRDRPRAGAEGRGGRPPAGRRASARDHPPRPPGRGRRAAPAWCWSSPTARVVARRSSSGRRRCSARRPRSACRRRPSWLPTLATTCRSA